MDVEVHIDRLLLEGLDIDGMELDNRSACAVAAAIEAELAHRLAGLAVPGTGTRTGGTALRAGATARISAEPVSVPRGTTPAGLGRQIGATVFGGVRHD